MLRKDIFLFVLILLFIFGLFDVFAFAASKIDSAVFGDIKARNIGPAVMSGRITDIQCVESDPDIIYVGTASGGIWKSKDRGITFKPLFDKYTMSVGCMTIDPGKPDTVWVGTGETNMRNSVSVGTGLYRTGDGGKTWKFMGFKDSERISKVILDPNDANTVYAAVAGHLWNAHPERGVYKSTDNGKTWEQVLYVNENTGCIDLDIHPGQSNILFAAMWEFRRKPWFFTSGGKGSGLFKSVDGGKTWKKLQKGLPKGELGRIALDIAPSKPEIVYALVEAEKTALYKSFDSGESWEKVGTSFGLKMRPFYFANITVDPADPERIYNSSYLLSVSTNGGKSFNTSINSFFRNTVHPDHHALWINPQDPKHVLVGTDGGVYVSFSRAGGFRHLANLPVSQFYHVAYDLETPYNVYGGLQDNGSWYGPSRFIKGRYIPNKSWNNVGGGDGFHVFRDPIDKDIVYASWQGGNLQRHNEKTHETADIKPLPSGSGTKYRFNWNAGVALSPTNKNTLYIGAQYLFKSTDKGGSWTKISPDLTTNDPQKQQQHKSGGITIDNTGAEDHCSILTISESPLDENIIWVGTDDGNLQVTVNGGKKWKNTIKNINGLPANTWCSTVEAGHFNKAAAYVVFDGHRTGDMTPYIYKTGDLGKTWTALAAPEIQGFCHVIREDTVKPNLLFLGTEFGLYVSFNSGRNWVHFTETLPKVAVRDIRIHPVEHDLILGTHGRGIYILDDITPLRHLDETVFQENVVILPARPSYAAIPSMSYSASGDAGYFGVNPKTGATITYYLKKRHIFGDFKLEILNSKGEVIKQLPTRKRRGINRVSWGMTLRPPKAGAAPGMGGIVFRGPMVEPGLYTIRLTKNKKHYTSTIELKPDQLTTHSSEDRKQRHQAIMKIYSLLEHLAYLADTMKDVTANLRDILEKEEKKLSRSAKKLIRRQADQLEETRNSVVGKSMYDRDTLQRKMIGLYSSISRYAGKPSDSQLVYTTTLEKSLEKVEEKFNDFVQKGVPRINDQLRKAKIAEIRIPTEEQYRKKIDR